MSERIPPKEYLTRPDLAAMISMSIPWIKKQEKAGTGCPRISCGRSVRYEYETVRRWMSERMTNVGAQSVA
jgi:predicted DNA-binding transcriptional regulator AlpA